MIGTFHPRHDKPLFSGHHLITYLDERMRAARKAVDAIPTATLLSVFVDELATELTTRFALDIVVVLRDCVTESCTDIVVPRDALLTSRLWFSEGADEAAGDVGPAREVVGQLVRFHVPFVGNSDLLALRGSQRSLVPPRAELRPGSLVFGYPTTTPGALASARTHFARSLAQTCEIVDAHVAQVEEFDRRLEPALRHLIQARRSRLATAFGIANRAGV